MCGLTVFYNISKLDKETNKLYDYIKNRGPDKKIIKKYDNLNCLFSRLAIQDLSDNGDQPILSKSKNLLMLFNGEIYNHYEIRTILINKYQHKIWSGTSDSETLVESFDYLGINETLKLIKGMFSIFLYHFQHKRVFLMNDIFGEKPLYYQINKNSFMVSSSINSFNYQKNILNIKSVKELVTNNYINHPQTIWKNIYKIKPASLISFNITKNYTIENKSSQIYYDKSKKFSQLKESLDSLTNKLEKKLFESIESQLISDVPIGSFLSGGIDSTLITAIASKISSSKLNTFTIGFNSAKFNEAIYAKKIANHLGTIHHEKYLDNKNLSEILMDVFKAYDEPFSDSSQIPTILLSKFCSSKVKVSLTGDGGDELFGGYNRYNFNPKIWRILKFFPFFCRNIASKLVRHDSRISINVIKQILFFFNSRLRHVHYFDNKIVQLFAAFNSKNLFEFTNLLSSHIDPNVRDNYLFKNFKNDTSDNININYNEDLNGLMTYDIYNYLPGDLLVKVDRAAMYYGLETRAPFLDKHIYEFSKSLPKKYKIHKGQSKIILKNLLKKLIPENLIDRPKQGFLLPINEILRNNELIHEIDFLFNEKKIDSQNIFNGKFIVDLWKRYKEGYFFDQYLIWDLIIFQKWLDRNINI